MFKDISEGLRLFNDFDFFSAHDFFENLWNESDREERLFFQGMVQVSVASYHLINRNYKGAVSQYIKSKTKLEQYPGTYYGIDLSKLLKEVNLLILDLEKYFSGDLEEIDLEKIPTIKFKH